MNEMTNNFSNRFQRSIRIDTDFNDLAIVNTFVSSETADRAIIDMCHQIQNGQQAFTWTGSYGSGKSSLALILHGSLSHKNHQLYKKSINLIGEKAKDEVKNTFENFSKRIVLPIVAGRNNLENLINKNLSKYDKENTGNIDLFSRITALSEKQQLIIFVDELGKYLEFASSVNQDIMFLQNLAELCNRSKGKVIFIGILHQSFSEYSKTSDQSIRDEWSKIQGRFIDIPINVSAEEQINLMSHSLSYDKGKWDNFDTKDHIQNFKKELKNKHGWLSLDTLNNLYPLNPVSAFLISAISKRAFAQNQRTIFGFLNSVEPFGFKTIYFTEKEKSDFNYSPSHLWDYLYANLDVSISNSSDAHSWITSVDIIEQARSTLDKFSLEVLKCISLFQIFGSRSLIKTTIENIYASFPFETSNKIDETLNVLLNKKYLLYREISKTFHISEASDFDLELALKPYLENDNELNDETLSKIIDLKPIIGKRHYIETGNFRFLKIVVKTFENFKNYIYNFKFDGNGEIIICLPSKDELKSQVKSVVENAVRDINFPLAVAYPRQSLKIIKLLKKLSALELIQKNNEVIEIDKIARKEVATSIDLTKKEIEFLIENLFFQSDWFVSCYEKNHLKKWSDLDIEKPHTLNSEVSNLFDEFFPYGPVIKNELTNKTKVCGNAN
jgi:energy-coupling factor transporter ATP-binding protein EcfA2